MRKAIRSVYHGFLPSGKHPRVILSLTLAPNLVDVNVHPTKREVRYTSPHLVYQLVQNALEKHLILQSSLRTTAHQPESTHPVSSFRHKQEDTSDLKLELKPETNTRNYSINKIHYERKPLFESGLDNIAENDLKDAKALEAPGSLHLAKVSELTLRKVISGEENKSNKAHKGNQTDFTIQSGKLEVSGQVSGPKWIRDKYLQTLNQWLLEVELDLQQYENASEQTQIFPSYSSGRPHLKADLLEAVWQRDGWRCVYCGKYLLHPQLVKKALRSYPNGWISRVGANNKLLKTHLLREHQATYDHYLPFSHNPSLSAQEDNLFASCRSCNQAKSSSTDTNKWKPQKFEPWTSPQSIGSLLFLNGQANSEFQLMDEALST